MATPLPQPVSHRQDSFVCRPKSPALWVPKTFPKENSEGGGEDKNVTASEACDSDWALGTVWLLGSSGMETSQIQSQRSRRPQIQSRACF